MTASASVFSTGHIALTGAVTGVLSALAAAALLRRDRRIAESLIIGLLAGGAVFSAAQVGEHAAAQ